MECRRRGDEMLSLPLTGTQGQEPHRQGLSFFWALLPLLTLGIATPFLIAFAAGRLRSRTLGWCSAGWLVAMIASFGLAGPSQGPLAAVFNILIITTMVGGAFQAFALRPAVFRLDTLDVDRRARRQASRIVTEHPKEAVRLKIGRVDIDPQQRIPDGGLADVNNSEASVLGQALRLDNAQLMALVQARRNGGFSSLADFIVRTGMDPHAADAFADRLVFLPVMGRPGAGRSHRRVSPARVVADGRSAGVPTRTRSCGTSLSSWLWTLLPAVTGGTAAAPAMAFAAARLRDRRLWIASVLYLAALLGLALIGGFAGGLSWDWIAPFCLGGVATVHAFVLRKDVFEVDVVRSDKQKRRQALKLVAQDPQEAIRLSIGRVDIPEADRYPDGGLIDMNNIPSYAMRAATGIDEETADRIVSVRKELWGFESLGDLCMQLDLAPQAFDAVSERLVFLPLLGSPPQTAKVR